MDDRNAIFREEIIMQIIKSKKENVKGYACAPSVLAGAAAMGVMVVALFVVLRRLCRPMIDFVTGR